jgi:hypothetical protein
MKTTHLLATGLVIALSLLAPGMARANTYTVEGCGANGAGAFQFSSTPTNAFTLSDDQCDGSSDPTYASMTYLASDTYTQGDQGSWGVQAPAGEAITGLGVVGGFYSDTGGWLSGWTLNGNIDQDATPSGDDCLGYRVSPCDASGSGWFPIANANSVELISYCDAAAVPTSSCSVQSDYTNSLAVFNDAVVQIQDPGNASPEVSGSLWGAGEGLGLKGGWISGINVGADMSLGFQATDPGGVCTLEAVLTDANGDVVASSTPVQQAPVTDPSSAAALADDVPAPFVSSQPCGGPSTGVTTFAPDLGALPTGTYDLNVAAQNPGEYQAGDYTYAAGDALAGGATINVDNSIPSVTVAPSGLGTTSGGSAQSWSATAESLTVSATDAAGSSGLAQITCTTPSGTTAYQVSGDQASVAVDVSAPGSDSVSCDATSAAGNTSTVATADFEVDAQVPTLSFAGAAFAPAWDGGTQNIIATGSEVAHASGIASVSCQVDGGAWTITAGTAAHITVVGDGKHGLSCYTTTVAGISSPTASESVQIDSDAPTLVLSRGPAQAAWHTTAQTITADATAFGGDEISAINCTLAGTELSYPNTSNASTESIVIPVLAPGGDLNCDAQDTAGNVSRTESWSFLIDDTPPAGYFVAADSTKPTRVEVSLSDDGSGVAGARIQINVDGAWRSLPTRFHEAQGVANAEIPDNGSIRNGTYELRAKAWDKAGNRNYVTQSISGAPESIALPLREVADLTAVVSAGHAYVAATASSGIRSLSVQYGRKVRVVGRLVTASGTPVGRADIVISERLSGARAIRKLAEVTTTRNGDFSRTLGPSPSRTLLVSYEGSSSLRSASAATNERVTGEVELTVPRLVVAGKRVTMRGFVAGGYVPPGGLLVQLWYAAVGGRGGWQPFDHAVRANHRGEWALTFPASGAASGREYVFKAVVSAQGGWPYTGAISRPASLKVV